MIGFNAVFENKIRLSLNFWREKISTHKSFRHIQQEHQNILRAVSLGLSTPPLEHEAIDLALQAFPYVETYFQQSRWLPIYIAYCNRFINSNSILSILASNKLGQLYKLNGDFPEALRIHRIAENKAQTVGAFKQLAQSRCNIAEVYLRQHSYQASRDLAFQALAHYNSEHNPQHLMWRSSALNTIGESFRFEGDYDQAIKYLNKAYDMAQAMKHALYSARFLNNLALAHQGKGNVPEAILHLHKALLLIDEDDHKVDKINFQINTGFMEAEQHEWKTALQIFDDVDLNYLKYRNPFLYALTLTNLGYTLLQCNYIQDSLRTLKKSMIAWETLGDEIYLANTYGSLAEAFEAAKQLEEQKRYLQLAVDIMKTHQSNVWVEENLPIYQDKLNGLNEKGEG